MNFVFFIWNNFIPTFIKNIIKKIIFIIKYKNNEIGMGTIENLPIFYILSNKLNLGNNVNLGNKNYYSGNIRIGDNTYINSPNSKIAGSEKHNIIIGKFCSISWGVNIISKNFHDYNKISTSDCYNLHKYNNDIGGDIIIGNDVWIGCNVIILPGVKIGNGTVIGAGSVVTKNTPEYSIVAGNPAKILKYRFNEEKIKEINKSNWWNLSIDEIKKLI